MNRRPKEADGYRRVARFYDGAAALYSLGRIERSKSVLLKFLTPGASLLLAGAGSGSEATSALRKGARVVAAERSAAMRGRLENRVQGSRPAPRSSPIPGTAGGTLEFEEDVRELFTRRNVKFDAIGAHYFLNVFAPDDMRAMLAGLAGLLRPGGRLFIADFAPAGRGPRAILQRGYFYLALAIFRLLAPNAWHSIYDYEAELEAAGLALENTVDFPLPAAILPGYRVWIARKF